jgi:LacI family transcriptional regulator
MRDVAALAGVSLKTVSRVVNREVTVSPDLARRVEDAIRRLDYRHNTNASNLRRADQKTATIGLLLENLANPYSAALHRAIEDFARQRGFLVFAGSCDEDPQREMHLLRALIERRVDGLIVVPVGDQHDALAQARRNHRPVVFVDRLSAGRDADSVTVDNRAGTTKAIAHLASFGHRRIAFMGDLRSIWTAEERYLGYVEGLAAHGLRLDPTLVRHDLRGIEIAEAVARDLFTQPDAPTAIFAAQNLVTMGVIRALKRMNLHHRIALVGFDDFPLADLLEQPVSVVAQDAARVGCAAAELLFSRLDGERSPAQHIVVPTQLLVRGSGEILT